MTIRLVEYFQRMDMDYMTHLLEGQPKWDEDTEVFYKYLPLLLLKEKAKLKTITTERSYRQGNTRFKLKIISKPTNWDVPFEKTVTFDLTDGTLRHEFFFETYYNAQFRNHMEWYLHDRKLQQFVEKKQND